jgi:hypothetical protein
VQLYRWFPSIRQVLTIVRPETLIRWHRLGFRCYRRWKSRSTGGRPRIESELRVLIRRIGIVAAIVMAAVPKKRRRSRFISFDILILAISKAPPRFDSVVADDDHSKLPQLTMP